ncbi:beta/gamma crystallin domain-containing protein 2 [Pseudophryne corroboree]|uniref:beta/gamma crystallin domain-containing protein 2 n=1 Tax=Pseudophryne corroboree TaxID=495146 RepID=UPI003082079C
MSSPTAESPTRKKQGLRKRLLKLFSRSEGNIKEKSRTRSEGDRSPAAPREDRPERKGRSSWSEKRGRKDRNEAQDGAESLPRLRHLKSEDPVLRKTSRDTKTRSLSYSELELPSTSLLQRFGSLTWRKKRFSALESSETLPNVSSPTESRWSMGRLDRPAVGSDLDLDNRSPKSSIVESPCPQFTPKNSDHCSITEQKVQRTLEISTSFDCLTDGDEDHNSSHEVFIGKTAQQQLPFAFPDNLEGEEEESLPCWAESILKDYLSTDHFIPGSAHHLSSGHSHSTYILEKGKEPHQYRSPLYQSTLAKDIIQEETFEKKSQVNNSAFSSEDVSHFKNLLIASSSTEIQRQSNQNEVHKNMCHIGSDTEEARYHIPLCTSNIPQDVVQNPPTKNIVPILFHTLPQEGEQNNAYKCKSPNILCPSTEKENLKYESSLNYGDSPQDGVQKEATQLPLQDLFQDETQNVHIYSSILGQEAAQIVPENHAFKEHNNPQPSPSATKIKYQVIITMTKEEKEQMPGLVQEMVKGEELVGLDLTLSPSVESQACGYHGAGPTEVTAQALTETVEHIAQTAAQEEEILTKRRGGQTCEGKPVNRFLSSAVNEDLPFLIFGSEQVAEYSRLDSSKMEKDYNHLPKRAQTSRMCEKQSSHESSKGSIRKDKDIAGTKKLSHSLNLPLQNVGHVKGLQKVFEGFSSREELTQHGTMVKPKHYGSLSEKNCLVPQDLSVVPGVHGPVFSQVYNPLKKDHLEKKSEHATVSVTGSAAKLHLSPILQSHMDSNRMSSKAKNSTSNDIAENKLTHGCHSDRETNHRHARPYLQDLQLPPRTPTPPLQKTKSNVSISLRSPKGWNNESVMSRSPRVGFGQRLTNQRDTMSPMRSQTSDNFFFAGGNVSNSMPDPEYLKKVGNTEANSHIESPGEIHKKHNIMNSQEQNKVQFTTSFHQNARHDGGHTIKEKETIHKSGTERGTTSIKNEIEEEYEAHEDSGQIDQLKNRLSDLQPEKKLLKEVTYSECNIHLVNLKLGDKEDYTEKNIQSNSYKSQELPPTKNQRERQASYSRDVKVIHKLSTNQREKLENSKDNQNVIGGILKNHIAESSGDVGTLYKTIKNADGDLSKDGVVKNKNSPTIILYKIANPDSVKLNKYTDNYKIENDNWANTKQQVVKDTVSKDRLSPKHKPKERKPTQEPLTHSELGIKSKSKPVVLSIPQVGQLSRIKQSKAKIDQAIAEQIVVVADKSTDAKDQQRDIMVQSDKVEKNTNVSNVVVNEVDVVPINKESVESILDQQAIDMKQEKSGDAKSLYKITEAIGVLSASTIDSSNLPVNKVEDLMDQDKNVIVSMTIKDRLMEKSNDLVVEISRTDPTINVIEDKTGYLKINTVNMKNKTEQEMVVLVDSFIDTSKHQVKDLMGQEQKCVEKFETQDKPKENSSDLSDENSSVYINKLNRTEDQTKELDKTTVFMQDQNEQEIVVLVDSFIESNDQAVDHLNKDSSSMVAEVEYMYEQSLKPNDLYFRKNMHQKLPLDPTLIVKVEDLVDQDRLFIANVERKNESMENSSDLPDENSALNIKTVNIIEDQTKKLDKKTVFMPDQTEQDIVGLKEYFIELNDQPLDNLKEESSNVLAEVEYLLEQNMNSNDLSLRNNMHQKLQFDRALIIKVEELVYQDQPFIINLESKIESTENSSALPNENSSVNIKTVNITEDQPEEQDKKTAFMQDQTGQEIVVLVDSIIESSDQQVNNLKEEPTILLAEDEHMHEQNINSNDLLFSKNIHQTMHNLNVKVEELVDQNQTFIVNVETKDNPMENLNDLPDENSAMSIKKEGRTEYQAEELDRKTVIMKDQTGQEIVALVDSFREFSNQPVDNIKEEPTTMLVEDMFIVKVEDPVDQDQTCVVNVETKDELMNISSDLPDEHSAVNITDDQTEEKETVNMKTQSGQEIHVLVNLLTDSSGQTLTIQKEHTYMLDKVEDLDQTSINSHNLPCAVIAQYGHVIGDQRIYVKENSAEHAKDIDNEVGKSSQVINQFAQNIAIEKPDVIVENHISDTDIHFGHTSKQHDNAILISPKSMSDKDVIIKQPEKEIVDQAGEVVLENAGEGTKIPTPAREKLALDYDKWTTDHTLDQIVDRSAYVTVDKSEKSDDYMIRNMSTENGSCQTNEDQVDHTINKHEYSENVNRIISTKQNLFNEPLGYHIMEQAGKVDLMQANNMIIDQTEDLLHHKKGILQTTEFMVSANEQQTGISNSEFIQGTVNEAADVLSQFGNTIDVVSSVGDLAENVNDESHDVNMHSSEMQNTVNLPQSKTNAIQESQDGGNIKISDNIVPMMPSEQLGGDVLGISFSGEGNRIHTADERCISGPSSDYPLQVKQQLLEQPTDFAQHYMLPIVEKVNNEAGILENATHHTEEEMEASENMEIWVNKLRQLETPEFMKYQREPRQPRSSPLHMYATLPPIKEDQGSPKGGHSDFKWQLQEQKEKLDMNPLPTQSDSVLEAKVTEQTEATEETGKKYSWERSTERASKRTSPLELMRKHSGDEISRSDTYKALITQNLSQRQSSIIGSLLLSDRLDKKSEASEGKSYSRLESSFLLSSYINSQKDKLKEMPGDTEIPPQKESSTDDTSATLTNNTLTITLEDLPTEDNKDFSHPQPGHVTDPDTTELPSKIDTPVSSSSFKVFPDVWHHPGKNHGKLNPRPGKIILYSESGFKGHSREIYSDVGYTSDWDLHGSISVRIIRGGWLLYEKPQFRGRRIMLSEGETDLTCPWEEDKSSNNLQDGNKTPTFWIGSLRHVVQDFQVPKISLFMDENGEGNKVTIVGATPDSRVYGQPTKTESIIVHSGLWLLYSKPFFEGDPYILEPGGYPNRKAWNGQDSHLCSLQPARIGGPTVEKPNEPKILLFQSPGFEGHSWEVTRDLNSLQGEPNSHGERLTTVGSLKVLGGCWVGYEKEGFHGHQYLLEEGEYKDCSQWGGCTEELGSLRHIHTDFSAPEIVLYENPGCSEGPCLRLNEALADIEVAEYGTSTGSIHVLNGVWLAYENVDFSGEQYILEKGIYHSCHDWGAKDSQVCSVQPVLQVGGQDHRYFPTIQLFSEPNFHGYCMTYANDHILLPENFSPQSCRVEGGSWIFYEGEDCCGEQYILAEGDYPTRTAMACQEFSTIRSLKKIPLYFSIPSISLHGLERFEGKELEFTGEVRSLQGEGYNNHVLSVRVASGIWVLYEHNDFRGRQWLLECTQIPNWLLYSGLQRIGSLCPIRQRKVYFRLRNRALGLCLCVPEPTGDMKAARVQVTELKEGSCDLWYYEEGRIKNQLVPEMSLQLVGMSCAGTKVVLWSEGRKPMQTWSLEDSGFILSCLFKGLCLDVKGGQSYDSDHVMVWEAAEDRPTQRWDLEVF